MNLRLLILDRYIIRKFLGTYFFAIAMIIIVVISFDVAENIQDYRAAHIPMEEILVGYYLNFIPYFVNQFSGLFTFIAVIFFTSKMAYDTEIIAILSSGVSFRRLMWPYFVAAFVIASMSLTLNIFLIPAANARRIEFVNTKLKQERRLNEATKQTQIYRQLSPGTYAFIHNYNFVEKKAAHISIETYEGDKMVRSMDAADAIFDEENGRWTAPRYITREFKDGRENLVKHERQLDTVVNLVANELGRVEDLVQTISTGDLYKFIDQQRSKGSDMVATFEIESNGRIAYPMSTFILTLIGVSLSSRKVRGGTGLHLGLGLALCFSYILLMRFTGEFAKTGLIPAWIAVWSPNFVYLIVGLFLYRRAPK